MPKSRKKMYNKILKEEEIGKQWEKIKINSIIKNKGSRKLVNNKRGIFLTSIVYTIFEKALKIRTGKIVTIEEHQSGGKKEAG